MRLIHVLAAPLLAAVAYAQNQPAASSSAASSAAASSAASSGSAVASSAPPPLSSSAASSAAASSEGPTNPLALPSLTGGGAPTTYSYPSPSVPPTADAPFMQKSNLPQGTVFICVGAILAGAFVLMLLWRAWAAWMLHRRMNAANAQYVGVPSVPPGGGSPKDRKLRKSGLYQREMGSEMSLDALAKKDHGHGRRSSKMPKGDSNRQSNLFFSPTAGAGAHGTAQQRASSFLPAGYYAAGGSTVGSTMVNANSTSDLSMRTGERLSMADFGAPNRTNSPYKDSPLLRPRSGNGLEPPHLPFAPNAGARNSVASLSGSEGHSRAPSAYLEDLFDSTPVKERRSNERDDWR